MPPRPTTYPPSLIAGREHGGPTAVSWACLGNFRRGAAKATILAGRLHVVAVSTQRRPIARVPEPAVIALVRHDVIDHRRRRGHAARLARRAQRVRTQERGSRLPPGARVAALVRAATLRILGALALRAMRRAVGLAVAHQPAATGVRTGARGSGRHTSRVPHGQPPANPLKSPLAPNVLGSHDATPTLAECPASLRVSRVCFRPVRVRNTR